jgi:hypothetical protein
MKKTVASDNIKTKEKVFPIVNANNQYTALIVSLSKLRRSVI